MAGECADCGCKVYGGHCTNCHEEHFIMEQNNTNDELIGFSPEFWEKVKEQEKKAKEIRDSQELSKLRFPTCGNCRHLCGCTMDKDVSQVNCEFHEY